MEITVSQSIVRLQDFASLGTEHGYRIYAIDLIASTPYFVDKFKCGFLSER